jgi:hypothetical protein
MMTAKRTAKKNLVGPTLVPWMARAGAKLRPVPVGDYGVVRMVRGKFKCYLGLYDNDGEVGLSIVYPWARAPADYVVVRHSSLALATPAEESLWEAVNGNPFAFNAVIRRVREQHGGR